jgi:hypothetical protein
MRCMRIATFSIAVFIVVTVHGAISADESSTNSSKSHAEARHRVPGWKIMRMVWIR